MQLKKGINMADIISGKSRFNGDRNAPVKKIININTEVAASSENDEDVLDEEVVKKKIRRHKIRGAVVILELLDKNRVPEKLLVEVGADGKLTDTTLSYVKSGDGVDSVDEIVKTEDVKQKLVYATVTYTNRSDKEITHMLYIGSLMLLNHEDGTYEIYDPGEQSGDGFDRVIW